jgi:hypothetical protein
VLFYVIAVSIAVVLLAISRFRQDGAVTDAIKRNGVDEIKGRYVKFRQKEPDSLKPDDPVKSAEDTG